MRTYRKKLVIEDPKRVILTDLPFRAGQTVEVLVLEEQADRERRAEDLKRLLKDTQALTQLRSITEEEIAAEIAAYREGRCLSSSTLALSCLPHCETAIRRR